MKALLASEVPLLAASNAAMCSSSMKVRSSRIVLSAFDEMLECGEGSTSCKESSISFIILPKKLACIHPICLAWNEGVSNKVFATYW